MADAVSTANSVISAVGEVALQAGEAALIAQFPFLGLPVIKQVWEYIANKYAQAVLAELEKGSAAVIITADETAKGKAASAAAATLSKTQNNPKATAEEKQRAKEDFKAKYSDLIRTRIATN
jgi:hypothetical protein